LNVKTARSGNHYIELDTYEPKLDGKLAETKSDLKPTKKKAAVTEDAEILPF
ncbi:MAG: hypothetical protein JHC33_03665, partial [Ignisphaera sp.]|nr:hypothetical protein [Ignisphaera sp.]